MNDGHAFAESKAVFGTAKGLHVEGCGQLHGIRHRPEVFEFRELLGQSTLDSLDSDVYFRRPLAARGGELSLDLLGIVRATRDSFGRTGFVGGAIATDYLEADLYFDGLDAARRLLNQNASSPVDQWSLHLPSERAEPLSPSTQNDQPNESDDWSISDHGEPLFLHPPPASFIDPNVAAEILAQVVWVQSGHRQTIIVSQNALDRSSIAADWLFIGNIRNLKAGEIRSAEKIREQRIQHERAEANKKIEQLQEQLRIVKESQEQRIEEEREQTSHKIGPFNRQFEQRDNRLDARSDEFERTGRRAQEPGVALGEHAGLRWNSQRNLGLGGGVPQRASRRRTGLTTAKRAVTMIFGVALTLIGVILAVCGVLLCL